MSHLFDAPNENRPYMLIISIINYKRLGPGQVYKPLDTCGHQVISHGGAIVR